MTTVIKIGDRVTWSNERMRKNKPTIMPVRINNCKVLKLFDIDGQGGATIDCGPLGLHADVYVADLELETAKESGTTILSGG